MSILGGGFPENKIISFNCFNAEHEPFPLKYSQVINDDMWCPRCRTKRNMKISQNDVEELCGNRGLKLKKPYVNNTTKLTLECVHCGASKQDWNYKALKRSEAGKNYCDACRDL